MTAPVNVVYDNSGAGVWQAAADLAAAIHKHSFATGCRAHYVVYIPGAVAAVTQDETIPPGWKLASGLRVPLCNEVGQLKSWLHTLLYRTPCLA